AEERLVFDELFRVHPLTREDVTREHRDPKGLPHLPKVEEFPDYLFVVVNPLHPKLFDRLTKKAADGLRARASCQLSAVLAANRLLTHHYESVSSIQKLHTYLDRHTEQAGR